MEGIKSLDQDKLADYLRTHTFKTVVGDVKFGANGEWSEPRVLEVQFRDIKSNDLAQFKNPDTEVILWPSALETGKVVYPYTDVLNKRWSPPLSGCGRGVDSGPPQSAILNNFLGTSPTGAG